MKYCWLLLFLSACNFRPDYCRPALEMPAEYRSVPNEYETYANLPWWEQFGDSVLNGLIRTALDNNLDLMVATARVLEFYEKYKVVFSQFLPQVSLAVTYDRLELSGAIPYQPLVPGFRFNNLFQLLGQVSYEFDIWGKIRNATAAAKASYLAQVDNRNAVIISLVSSVAKNYIQLLQFDEQLDIAKKTYEGRARLWDMAKKRFDAGLVSQMEVSQAESEVEGAQLQIKNFEAFITVQENLICLLMGVPPGPIPRGNVLQDFSAPPMIPIGLPSDLLSNRPDIMQAEQDVIAANALIGVAKANFFPSITLNGVQGQKSSELGDLFTKNASAFDYQLGALQPVYTGGRLPAQLEEARAVYLETVYAYREVFLTALKEVSDALIGHQKAKEKLEIDKKQQAALEEYFRLAKLRYFNGQADYLTVVESEKNLFTNQLDTVTTKSEIIVSLIDLYKALGQGWDIETNTCLEP